MSPVFGSFCPFCARPTLAQREASTGLLFHTVAVEGRREQHWWGIGLGTNDVQMRRRKKVVIVEAVEPSAEEWREQAIKAYGWDASQAPAEGGGDEGA